MSKRPRKDLNPIQRFRADRKWPKGVPMPKPGAYKGRCRWSDEDIELLRTYYPEYGGRYCARLLGRTKEAVKIKAERLGIVRQPLWIQEEIDYLRQEYARHGRRSCRIIAKAIGRTHVSVRYKAAELGLAPQPDYWGVKELRLLDELYGTMPQAEVAKRIGRSASSVGATASKRGLSNPHAPLTTQQERAIRRQLGRRSMEDIADRLGVAVNRVRTVADRIGFRSSERRRGRRFPEPPKKAPGRTRVQWTDEEVATLRELYPTHGAAYVAAILGRARKATAEKARLMGISASELVRMWSDEDVAYLRREVRPEDSRATLGRVADHLGRSVEQVYDKARRLRLLASAGTHPRRK